MQASNQTREHVAMACAYMNDVGLPNAYAMARAMSDLVTMLQAIDRNHFNDSGIVANDARVTAAARMVEALRPHLGVSL